MGTSDQLTCAHHHHHFWPKQRKSLAGCASRHGGPSCSTVSAAPLSFSRRDGVAERTGPAQRSRPGPAPATARTDSPGCCHMLVLAVRGPRVSLLTGRAAAAARAGAACAVVARAAAARAFAARAAAVRAARRPPRRRPRGGLRRERLPWGGLLRQHRRCTGRRGGGRGRGLEGERRTLLARFEEVFVGKDNLWRRGTRRRTRPRTRPCARRWTR